jgi:hypothetical protein
MPTWNGLMGLKEAPTAEAPRLIATATTGVKPSREVRSSRTGTKAISSSCIWMSAPPVAKARPATGTTSRPRPASAEASEPTSRPSAPVCSTTAKAPPTMKTKKTTGAAAIMPRGIPTSAWKGPTGAGSTRAYVPGTTTLRPVTGSSRRWYSPAGTTQLRAPASRMQLTRSVSG